MVWLSQSSSAPWHWPWRLCSMKSEVFDRMEEQRTFQESSARGRQGIGMSDDCAGVVITGLHGSGVRTVTVTVTAETPSRRLRVRRRQEAIAFLLDHRITLATQLFQPW